MLHTPMDPVLPEPKSCSSDVRSDGEQAGTPGS